MDNHIIITYSVKTQIVVFNIVIVNAEHFFFLIVKVDLYNKETPKSKASTTTKKI